MKRSLSCTFKVAIPVILLAFASFASATTLVGIWTDGKITVAADSKQTITRTASDGQVSEDSQTVCKIYEAQGLVFAFAGLAKAEQVDVVEAVKNAHELTEAGAGKKLPLESLIVASQATLVRVLKARRVLSDSKVDVGLIIAGKIDGKLQMIRQEIWGVTIAGDFSAPQISRRITYPDARGHDGTDPNRAIEVVGFSNAIKRFQTSSPNWSKGQDVNVARHLIEVETKDSEDSKFVGLPTSEVVITKDEIRWINKGYCH